MLFLNKLLYFILFKFIGSARTFAIFNFGAATPSAVAVVVAVVLVAVVLVAVVLGAHQPCNLCFADRLFVDHFRTMPHPRTCFTTSDQ